MRYTGVAKGWVFRAAGSPQGGLVEPFQVTAAWTQPSCSFWILIRGEEDQCVQMLVLLELELSSVKHLLSIH